MNPIRVADMDHIVLSVDDIERSLQFYTQVLGLPGERVEEFRAGKVGFPSVRINAATIIDLMRRKDPGAGKNLDHFCLVLEPLPMDDLMAYLQQQKVTVVTGPASRWGARGQATSVYILDPDSNQVELRAY